MADDKTQRIVEAAKARTRAEREVAERHNAPTPENRLSDEERAQMEESAQKMADLKVQPRAGTIDGDIDLEARGDVKGDGGDAKDYDEGDPDKYVSPTTAEYGLAEDTVRGPYFAGTTALTGDDNISERTRQEMSRGREVVDGRGGNRSRPRTRTVVSDDNDTDAEKAMAKARAEEKAKADAKK